jgi:hypothetical protein
MAQRSLPFGVLAILVVFYLVMDGRGQSPSLASKVPEADITKLSDGTVSGNTYHNADLGFRYEFPPGWTVSDKATQEKEIRAGHQFVWADDVSRGRPKPTQCSKALLLVSRYPEEMRLNEFNPEAFLVVADPRCLPGASFPSNVKDREAIQRIAGHLGIYFKTSDATSMAPPRVRAFDNGGRVMLEVSQSFSISRHEAGNTTLQNIQSSLWIMKAENYWVMLMFASADDAQLQKLRATRVFFDSASE